MFRPNLSHRQYLSQKVETKKRKCYGDYDELKRAEIAKWAIVNDNQPSAVKFGVPESTVRSIVKTYNKEKSGKYEELAKLPKRPRGVKPLLQSEIDAKVISIIKSMRASRHSITYDITISIEKGLVKAYNRTLLKEHGGSIDLHQTWAQSIHRRLGFVKRKATTSKQPVSPGFIHEVGFTFYSAIQRNINAYLIPPE